jgi:hypothetical protein
MFIKIRTLGQRRLRRSLNQTNNNPTPQTHNKSSKISNNNHTQEAECDLKQLLAAIGTNYLPKIDKIEQFETSNSTEFWILEASIAESANWKLSVAGSVRHY